MVHPADFADCVPFLSFDQGNREHARVWLQNFFDAFAFGILILDASGRTCMTNAAAHALFDIPSSVPLGDVTRFLTPDAAETFCMRCKRALHDARPGRHEDIFPLQGAAACWLRCTFTRLPAPEGGPCVCVTLSDVSEEKAALEQRELAAQRYHELFDAAADALIVVSPEGILLDLNTTSCEHMHMSREDLVGKPVRILFTEAEQQPILTRLEEILRTREPCAFEALLANPDSPLPVEINARPFAFQGQPAILGIARDITERKLLQARLERQASTDSLTALHNRRHFLLKAEQEFLRFKRYGNSFAMLILDLDYFKNVNDTYGHQTGDALLREFANQMRMMFRHSDVLGRIGGEEFAVLLLESGLRQGMEIAERLRLQVEKSPLRADGATVPYTVSIGLTTACVSDNSLYGIIRRADAALYLAKRSGRNQVRVSDDIPDLAT